MTSGDAQLGANRGADSFPGGKESHSLKGGGKMFEASCRISRKRLANALYRIARDIPIGR